MSKLPDYFMISECDGGLYDTRKPNWSATPIRKQYQYAHRKIETGLQLRSTLRVPFTFPGCYDVLLFTSDGGTLCNKCATKNIRSVLWSIRNRCNDGWCVVACDADCNFDEVTCDHCGQRFGAQCSNNVCNGAAEARLQDCLQNGSPNAEPIEPDSLPGADMVFGDSN